MLHHIMMQNISKKSPHTIDVDDAFHCDDGTMRVFLAILSPSWGAGAGERRVWGVNSKFSIENPLNYSTYPLNYST